MFTQSAVSRPIVGAWLAVAALVMAVSVLASPAPTVARAGTRQTTKAPATSATAAPKLESAIFSMGCFWCAETAFEGLPGVVSAVSGYTGGHHDHPTYEEVSTGTTGHYESIEVTFDPARISYAKLVDVFWHSIDPTQADGQFCDRGSEYRSVLFYQGEAQHRIAEQTKHAIEASGVLKKPIVTQILPASTFWPAEDYHQQFYKKDPERYHEYRLFCGRDRRLRQLWGDKAAKPSVD